MPLFSRRLIDIEATMHMYEERNIHAPGKFADDERMMA